MSGLGPLARGLINRYQGGFPLLPRPYARVATELGTEEGPLIATLEELLAQGWLSRFGPLYDAERLGGGLTLAALAVPEADFARVAEQVNAFAEVAHNYRREHPLNMWFVLATETPGQVREVLDAIAQATGLAVQNFPKLREFYLGLWVEVGEDGSGRTVPLPPAHAGRRTGRPTPFPLDPLDRRILLATQEGLPLNPEPYEALARMVGSSAGEVTRRLGRMLALGAVRRIGAVPNHYRLGLRANAMTVWDVADPCAERAGRRVGALDFVSHCYLRPRRPPLWPYNLFAMVHGREPAEIEEKVAEISGLLGADARIHESLLSSFILKKSGLRIAA